MGVLLLTNMYFMVVMGLVLGQTLRVVLPSWTKHFDRSVHVGSSDLTCVQTFKPIPLTFFEVLGFKPNNKNTKKKNWRNGLFAICPMLVVHLQPNFGY